MRPIEDDVDRQLLSAAIAKLEEREREIITLRFGPVGIDGLDEADGANRNQILNVDARVLKATGNVITLRFGLGGGREQTQKEVADRLGISQSYISRLEKRISP